MAYVRFFAKKRKLVPSIWTTKCTDKTVQQHVIEQEEAMHYTVSTNGVNLFRVQCNNKFRDVVLVSTYRVVGRYAPVCSRPPFPRRSWAAAYPQASHPWSTPSASSSTPSPPHARRLLCPCLLRGSSSIRDSDSAPALLRAADGGCCGGAARARRRPRQNGETMAKS